MLASALAVFRETCSPIASGTLSWWNDDDWEINDQSWDRPGEWSHLDFVYSQYDLTRQNYAALALAHGGVLHFQDPNALLLMKTIPLWAMSGRLLC